MTTRAEFVTEARRWTATRWVHQGRTHGVGVDCAGLLTQTARTVGPMPAAVVDQLEQEIAGYGRVPKADMLRRVCDKYLKRIQPIEAVGGDIALMRFAEEPQHLAIFVERDDGLGIIHSLASARKVVEHRLDSVWRGRIVDCYSVF